LDGGTNNSANPSSYTTGTGVAKLAEPTRSGYKFLGWYNASTGGTQVLSIGSASSGNITLYARWEKIPETFSITYQLDGGTNASSNPSTYTEGTGVSGFANPSRSGYNFLGWYNAASGGSMITSISSTATGNITLYARWEKIPATYTITYNLDGGTNGSNPSSYTEGTGVSKLDGATKNGYNFLGWFSTATGGTQYTSIPSTSTGNITLYARWEIIPTTYTITYNLDGGTNSGSNPATVTEGERITLSDATRSNYAFAGWYDENGNNISSVYGNNNITLTAKWKKKYTVTFNIGDILSGGSFTYVVTEGDGHTAPSSKSYEKISGDYFNADLYLKTWTSGSITVNGGDRIDNLNVNAGDNIVFSLYESSINYIRTD